MEPFASWMAAIDSAAADAAVEREPAVAEQVVAHAVPLPGLGGEELLRSRASVPQDGGQA